MCVLKLDFFTYEVLFPVDLFAFTFTLLSEVSQLLCPWTPDLSGENNTHATSNLFV